MRTYNPRVDSRPCKGKMTFNGVTYTCKLHKSHYYDQEPHEATTWRDPPEGDPIYLQWHDHDDFAPVKERTKAQKEFINKLKNPQKAVKGEKVSADDW